jgi:eukaryotic-like serine/threonine-protein kinase
MNANATTRSVARRGSRLHGAPREFDPWEFDPSFDMSWVEIEREIDELTRICPNYRVRGPIAVGGMGEVLEVEDVRLGRIAAMKVLREELSGRWEHAARLENEARVLARLGGRRAPAVYELGSLEDGRPYFVMERLVGRDLADRPRARLAVSEAVRIVTELLVTLEELHAAGVVHRDLKAENVFLTDDGRVVLLDFGLAREVGGDLRMTRHGVALGTPRMMAPERSTNGPGDERSDLYAVGLILYELLAGRGPFDDAETLDALQLAHRRRLPKPLSERGVVVPARLEEVVSRALAKAPRARFECAGQMRLALEGSVQALEDEVTTLDPPRMEW